MFLLLQILVSNFISIELSKTIDIIHNRINLMLTH